MSYWWINTDHWFFLRKLWREQYINVNCQVVYGEWQPVFHIFLYFCYTGVWVPEGLDQPLLLLLEAGEATGGPSWGGGGGALGQGKEPAHPPRGPGPEALESSGLLLPVAQPGGSPATEERDGTPGTQVLGVRVFSKQARPGLLGF